MLPSNTLGVVLRGGLARSQGMRSTEGNEIESGVDPIPDRPACADHAPPKNGASNSDEASGPGEHPPARDSGALSWELGEVSLIDRTSSLR